MPSTNINTHAKKIFEEIRDRPYRGAIYPQKAQNCYFKSLELIERLIIIGFPMRARVGDIKWTDTIAPTHITDLIPKNSITTHFYPEIFIDDQWQTLDPSWNKSFAQKYNLPYSEFGADNKNCFKIIKLYNNHEQTEYFENWSKDNVTDKNYALFTAELNKWLEDVNPEK